MGFPWCRDDTERFLLMMVDKTRDVQYRDDGTSSRHNSRAVIPKVILEQKVVGGACSYYRAQFVVLDYSGQNHSLGRIIILLYWELSTLAQLDPLRLDWCFEPFMAQSVYVSTLYSLILLRLDPFTGLRARLDPATAGSFYSSTHRLVWWQYKHHGLSDISDFPLPEAAASQKMNDPLLTSRRLKSKLTTQQIAPLQLAFGSNRLISCGSILSNKTASSTKSRISRRTNSSCVCSRLD